MILPVLFTDPYTPEASFFLTAKVLKVNQAENLQERNLEIEYCIDKAQELKVSMERIKISSAENNPFSLCLI
jgi:hypothetical protein